MSTTPTRNFSLTAELDNFIRAQVSTGHYANASEVVRAALRLLIERQPQRGAKHKIKADHAAKPIG